MPRHCFTARCHGCASNQHWCPSMLQSALVLLLVYGRPCCCSSRLAKQKLGQTGRQADRDRQTDGWTDGQTDRREDGQTDRVHVPLYKYVEVRGCMPAGTCIHEFICFCIKTRIAYTSETMSECRRGKSASHGARAPQRATCGSSVEQTL